MQLLILHLSDIHFNKSGDNVVLGRADRIAAALSSVHPKANTCFIVISGDIAFSGDRSEYQIAGKFFSDLKSNIQERFHDLSIKFVLVPGNHDCDFSVPNEARHLLIERLTDSDLEGTVYSTLLEVQSNYQEFASNWFEDQNTFEGLPNVFWVEDYYLEDSFIRFQLLNTALLSVKDEKQGRLIFPSRLISSVEPPSPSPDLVISVMHHPYIWIDANNARELQDAIETTSDLLLTGHEHEGDHYQKERYSGERVEFIEGGALQETSNQYMSAFSIISIDTECQSQSVFSFGWNEDGHYQVLGEPISVPLQRNTYRLSSEYIIKQSFKEDLSNPGVKFTHPAKESITLDDLFVYPDIRLQNLPDEKEFSPRIVRDEIPTFIYSNKNVLIAGFSKSGKTSIAKQLFKDLRRFGLVPTFISGETIRKSNEEYIAKLIEDNYKNQYDSPDFTLFDQLPIISKALVVDDFHKSKLNTKGRNIVLRILQRYFGYLVIFTDESSRYDDLLTGRDTENILWQFTHCEILPLGQLRRSDLVEKWVYLGQRLTANEAELSLKMARTLRTLTQLLGTNFVPPYPLFILVMLQNIELGSIVDTASKSGSFGYIYEVLLTTALASSSKLDPDLETQYNYLSELAYQLFESRNDVISKDRVYEWHSNYCKEYSLRLNFDELLGSFCDASVLKVVNSSVTFCYPYLYYYFVARYFRDHLNEETIIEFVLTLSKRLHNTESANVLLFLSYLSKDPLILDAVVSSAHDQFSEYIECDLDEHTSFIKELANEIPDFVIGPEHPDERRKKLLERKDEKLDKEENVEDEPETLEDIVLDRELNEFLQLNVAFKTVTILGQVLRNYAGSLKGDRKLELARNTYSLGLRVVKFIFEAIENEPNEIIEALIEIVSERHPEWSDKRLSNEVSNLLFNLSEGLAFVMIKHISDSVGDERLGITFSDLISESKNLSYSLIDLSIRLDYFPGIPSDEILSIFKKVRKNIFAAQIVKHIVWYYFYLYPARFDTRESLCKQLGIKLQPYVVHDPRPKRLKSP